MYLHCSHNGACLRGASEEHQQWLRRSCLAQDVRLYMSLESPPSTPDERVPEYWHQRHPENGQGDEDDLLLDA